MPTEELTADDLADDDMPDEFDDEFEPDAADLEETELVDIEDLDESDSDEDDADEEEEGDAEALDELEAEELEMLTDDETSETLVVDEAAEMRAIRREELAMDRKGADEATEGEFVCTSCFLVLKTSQLAEGRRKVCRDCAA